jgi:hypothetical protein
MGNCRGWNHEKYPFPKSSENSLFSSMQMPVLPSLCLLLTFLLSSLSAQVYAQGEQPVKPLITVEWDERPVVMASTDHDFTVLYQPKPDEFIESVRIFDRWGNLFFESADLGSAPVRWDGWSDQKTLCPEGTYTFFAEVVNADGLSWRLSGWVTLIHSSRNCG